MTKNSNDTTTVFCGFCHWGMPQNVWQKEADGGYIAEWTCRCGSRLRMIVTAPPAMDARKQAPGPLEAKEAQNELFGDW